MQDSGRHISSMIMVFVSVYGPPTSTSPSLNQSTMLQLVSPGMPSVSKLSFATRPGQAVGASLGVVLGTSLGRGVDGAALGAGVANVGEPVGTGPGGVPLKVDMSFRPLKVLSS